MSAPRAASAMACSQPGVATSSASQKTMKSPRAARAPTLRAWLMPWRAAALTTRSRGSLDTQPAATPAVSSVEALSAMTTSQAPGYSWRDRPSSWPAMTEAALRAGRTTLTSPGNAGGTPVPLREPVTVPSSSAVASSIIHGQSPGGSGGQEAQGERERLVGSPCRASRRPAGGPGLTAARDLAVAVGQVNMGQAEQEAEQVAVQPVGDDGQAAGEQPAAPAELQLGEPV